MLALLLGGEKFPESYTKLMANNTAYTIASNGDRSWMTCVTLFHISFDRSECT
jgi:hypothetical protein